MDKERVKLILHNMELLVQSLKKELEEESPPPSVEEDFSITPYEGDYDEVFSG